MIWDDATNIKYQNIKNWFCINYIDGSHNEAEECAKDLMYDIEEVKMDIQMLKIESKYIRF